MNLLDLARKHNPLFFSATGFTTTATIKKGDLMSQVECFFSRTEETIDKMSRIPLAQQTAQISFSEATLPDWFDKACTISLVDSAMESLEYKIETINKDRMLARVHVYLALFRTKEIPT